MEKKKSKTLKAPNLEMEMSENYLLPCLKMSSSLWENLPNSPALIPINSGTEVKKTESSTKNNNNSGNTSKLYRLQFGNIEDLDEDFETNVDFNIPNGERCVYSMCVKQGLEKMRKSAIHEATIMVVGNKSVGKSTIIQQLVNQKDFETQQTIALHYYWVRRRQFSQPKQVCCIKEVGGNAVENEGLMEIPITFCKFRDRFTIIIVLDLSQPQTMWEMLEYVVQNCRIALEKDTLPDWEKEDLDEIQNRLDARLQQLHGNTKENSAQNKCREIFPNMLAIIGGKYDEFCVRPIEHKRVVCRLLRLFAYKVGASICFYSAKQVAMNRRMRDFLSFYAFDLPFPSYLNLNPDEPLMIPHSYDSFDEIIPNQDPSKYTFEYLKNEFKANIGVEYTVIKKVEYDMFDPRYAEPSIDRKIAAKLKKIEKEMAERQQNQEFDFFW